MKLIIFLFIHLGLIVLTQIFLFVIYLRDLLALSFGGAYYVPSKREKIAKMMEFAEIKPGEKAVDLGSGDGRLIIALAKAGAEAHGYEVDPVLIPKSKRNIREAGLENKAFVHWGSFWRADLSEFDVVVIFGMSHVMRRLEKKLRGELKKDARVVANTFEFPTWIPKKKDNNVYLYENNFH